MTMASSSCEGQDRIPDRQACGTSPCSSWQVGAWSNVGSDHDIFGISLTAFHVCIDVLYSILNYSASVGIKLDVY